MDFVTAEKYCRRAIDKELTDEDISGIVAWPEERLSILFAATDLIRRHFFADTVEVCAIMNIKSGGCSEDCAFCSQSAHNSASVAVQALSRKEEIHSQFQTAASHGLQFGVVSSGKRLSPAEIDELAAILAECNGPTHASLGILSESELAKLNQAGVICYNHNLETGRTHFSRIVTTHSYDDRIATVQRAADAGMRVCCGGIFGIGESWDDRVELFSELRSLDVDIVPLNFLNAIPGTRLPLPGESPLQFLKIIALCRMMLPDKIIKVCGGREANLGKLQGLMFYAGAGGYISGDYLTTSGDSVESDDTMISGLGLRKSNID
ncbi:MAG: biotin synthase BioB [Chitinivibrionales bacterium]|nr:biotin synthase BioB [Chitinivibrionales bacterium]